MYNFFRDDQFQFQVLCLICRDGAFLLDAGESVDEEDFKPIKNIGYDRWIVSNIALDFWRKYQRPVRELLSSEIRSYGRQQKISEQHVNGLLSLAEQINKTRIVAADATLEKIKEYKKERVKQEAVEQMVELQQQGELTDAKWIEVFAGAIDKIGSNGRVVTDYFSTLDARILRRGRTSVQFPSLMIDPLDAKIQYIGPGCMGIWMAYFGIGKSIALLWTSYAYVLQGLNVLYLTLEDPREEVENRLDALVTQLPVKNLMVLPKRLRQRFGKIVDLIQAKLKIVDCTEDPPTVPQIAEIWERERRKGFVADAVIVDYDDEIRPSRKQTERRFEFADIYRDLRQFAAKRHIILWTAAQTNRKSENKKVITAEYLADDVSKARKVSLAIGIGYGDFGDRSKYLWVEKHKFDQQHVGCNIMTNTDKALFFDQDETYRVITNAPKQP
jgi:replicative DNA helicase